MAKGKGSLFSLNSQGRIGDLVFKKGHVVSERPLRLSEGRAARTPGQLAAQARYLAACQYWHTLTGAELAYWQDRAGTLSTNGGFSEFVSSFLKGELDMEVGHFAQIYGGDISAWNKSAAWGNRSFPPMDSGFIQNYPVAAIGDWIETVVWLSPGTWRACSVGHGGPFCGIADFSVNGVVVSTWDFYYPNIRYGFKWQGAEFTVDAWAPYTLRCAVTGKNVASTGYTVLFYALGFVRTA